MTSKGHIPGTAQAFQNSFTGMGLLLLAMILVIYIILGILYESFIHPLTILLVCLQPASEHSSLSASSTRN